MILSSFYNLDEKENIMATAKDVVKKSTTKTATPVIAEEKVEVVKKEPRKFEKDDLIPCRSVTPGLLLYNGAKSGIPYSWTNIGDVSYMEYQDLLAAMVSGSSYIFDPLFVIEDDELLEQTMWNQVKKLYESVDTSSNIKEILDLPVNKFRKTLEELPKGMLNAVKAEVSTQLNNGTFDSYQKVKIIDDVCGTDLIILMK